MGADQRQELELNRPLACAFYMKEDLRLLWPQANKQAAESFLLDWVCRTNPPARQ